MSLAIAERIAQVAEHFAEHDTHGYSQPHRGEGDNETIYFSDGTHATISDSDVDCSEMVRQCVNAAFDREVIDYMWTGNEHAQLTNHGFACLSFSRNKVARGDVLWVSGHTGVALGGGMQADAHGDEYGGITGPNAGDQTGHEVEVRDLRGTWSRIYRYIGQSPSGSESECAVDETIRFTDDRNIRSEPRIADDTLVAVDGWHEGETCRLDGLALGDGRVWGTYIGGSGNRRYVSLGPITGAEVV